MKSFTIFALLAVLLVCLLGQQQLANASLWGDIKNDADDVGHDAEKVADATAHVAEEGASHIHSIDKVANEIEPVAKVVATGLQIGAAAHAL